MQLEEAEQALLEVRQGRVEQQQMVAKGWENLAAHGHITKRKGIWRRHDVGRLKRNGRGVTVRARPEESGAADTERNTRFNGASGTREK